MATKRLTKAALIAAHDELDKEIGIEPPIDSELKLVEYEKELHETVMQLELTDVEVKGLSEKTQTVLTTLNEKHDKVEAPKEEEKPVEEETPKVEEKEEVKKEEIPVEEETSKEEVEDDTKTTHHRSSNYPKRIAMYDAIAKTKKGLTLNEWVQTMDDLYVKNGGVSNIAGTLVYVQLTLPALIIFKAILKEGKGKDAIYFVNQ